MFKSKKKQSKPTSGSNSGPSTSNGTTPGTKKHQFTLPVSLGFPSISPKKKRSKHNNDPVPLPMPSLRQKLVSAKLARLRTLFDNTPTAAKTSSSLPDSSNSNPDTTESPTVSATTPNGSVNAQSDTQEPVQPFEESWGRESSSTLRYGDDNMPFFDDSRTSNTPETRTTSRKTAAEEAAEVVVKWKVLIPTLMEPLLQYQHGTYGLVELILPSYCCSSSRCMEFDSQVHVYHFEYHGVQTVHHCSCKTLAQALVERGFFPTSPSQHQMAIAIPLLDFYLSISEENSDAVTALAGALEKMYRRQGFRIVDSG
ncbi:hypothetical protein PM082_020738 [Marasmius tenuissimus]|nr:hypothetical protein PM082_020738 [Marasmius tenuissimus]